MTALSRDVFVPVRSSSRDAAPSLCLLSTVHRSALVVPQHYHAAILHHQCNIVTHFFGVLGIRRTVILLKIWYHGIDERIQGVCRGSAKRGKSRDSPGQAPLSPARRGCVRNERSFGQ